MTVDAEGAALAALAGLQEMGPRRLAAVLADHGAPTAALAALAEGRAAAGPRLAAELRARPGRPGPGGDLRPLPDRWRQAAASVDLDAVAARHEAAGATVLHPGRPGWPSRLLDDPEPPALLVVRGDPEHLERPAVAIVGTRACTGEGRRVAFGLGRDLAEAGLTVVSGLALGIDAAGHRGALAGGGAVVGVVACGVDVAYPPSHAALYDEVAAAGAVLSEVPLGTRPERWRFPARNRIIAGLSDAVVVVESARTGGSMHTVDAAIERGRPVGAVPGPVRSPASAGTNALLAEQAVLVRDVDDVLVALGLVGVAPTRRRAAPAPPLVGVDADVLGAVGWTPTATDDVVVGTGLGLGAVLAALRRLEADGLVEAGDGAWCLVGRDR